jgi:AcrR family transcriptional regulator
MFAVSAISYRLGVTAKQPMARRGRPSTTSQEEIVEAATQIARRDGLPNLTMSRLAEYLGISTMTPYRYVANRQQLGELVVDAALSQVVVPDPVAGDWKTRITDLLAESRRVLLELKGTSEVICRALSTAIPQGVRLATAIAAILEEAGFGADEAILGYEIIYTYVVGQLGLDEAIPERERLHLDPLTAVPSQGASYDAEDVFSLGLAIILDGLEHNRHHIQASGPRRASGSRRSAAV